MTVGDVITEDWQGNFDYSTGSEREVDDTNAWISIKDRTPDKEGEYLANVIDPDDYDRRYISVVAFHCEDEWFDFAMGERVNITHWMTLPQPPQEEQI